MWNVQVSQNASEEEINQVLLEEVDFDYIRECVLKLKVVAEKYGPFKLVTEIKEDSSPYNFVKSWNNKTDCWECEELKDFDNSRIWTLVVDQWNGYSWMSPGYLEKGSGAKIVHSWFIAEKPFTSEDSQNHVVLEFVINVFFGDDEESEIYFGLDLWDLIETDELSDQAIMGVFSS